MRFCTFERDGATHAGMVTAAGNVLALRTLEADAPDEILGVISAGPELLDRLRRASERASDGTPLTATRLRSPIPRPARNVFCVGWNYSEHFEEGRQFRGSAQQGQPEIPAFPSLFTKNPATVIGPEAAIRFPSPHSEQLDWEAELAVVIGAGGCDIPESEAMRHVFGYMAANDVSVRDVQRRHGGQWFKGKNFDTHLPLGPWIVTADEVDPSDLAIRSRVNGVVKQDSRTRFMVFKIPRLIAEISAGCELWPGDVIITGTPAGVGFARTPPEYLKPGDVVEIEIEGIGTLRNIVKGGG